MKSSIFRVIFWKIDDFINSFRLNLTFSRVVKKSEKTNRKNKIFMRAGVNHEELDQVQVATCCSRVLKTGNIRKK